MALFEIRSLTKRFDGRAVLEAVDLDIHRGEFLTLIGRSGCGKTLLLKHLVGLVSPTEGEICFDGERVSGLSERAWIGVRRRIGVLFQAGALFDSLSVADNVAYGLREAGEVSETVIAEQVSRALAQVDLPGTERMWPASLSGGMRKRVALARAIALRPEVVLYDEPTEGLDPINVSRVNRLLLRLREEQGVTTIVATQNMRSAFSVSDRIAFIHEGRVAMVGSPAQLEASNDPRLAPFVRSSQLRAKTRPSVPDGEALG